MVSFRGISIRHDAIFMVTWFPLHSSASDTTREAAPGRLAPRKNFDAQERRIDEDRRLRVLRGSRFQRDIGNDAVAMVGTAHDTIGEDVTARLGQSESQRGDHVAPHQRIELLRERFRNLVGRRCR